MNRRQFFKRVAAACAAAVVAPATLVEPQWKKYARGFSKDDQKNLTALTAMELAVRSKSRQQGMNLHVDAPYGVPYWIEEL